MRVSRAEAWLTPAEVSAYLKVPVATLYMWRHRGKGPNAVKLGRHLRYRRRDVEAWLSTLAAAEEKASA